MRILYAVQGTGNGHVARARHLIPLLAMRAEVEVWISGTESQVDLPVLPKRVFSGISLKYNRKGGLSYLRTLTDNRWMRFVYDVLTAPIHRYDLVINDFEPVSAWASLLRGGTLIELSHQAGVRHPDSPRPKHRNALGEWILRYYAPSRHAIGFHVQGIPPAVRPPLIRHEIRFAVQQPKPQLLVYLPAYGVRELQAAFQHCPVPVRAFAPRITAAETHGMLRIEPVNGTEFLAAFCESDSVLCSAGFELPTEALFHGKRLAVIPIAGQYEQACNAAALRKAGAWQAKSLKRFKLQRWLQSPPPPAANWPDSSDELVDELLSYIRTSPMPTSLSSD